MKHGAFTREVWRRQYMALHEQLFPYVVRDGDWAGISPEAPRALADAYSALQSIGYANGWMP